MSDAGVELRDYGQVSIPRGLRSRAPNEWIVKSRQNVLLRGLESNFAGRIALRLVYRIRICNLFNRTNWRCRGEERVV